MSKNLCGLLGWLVDEQKRIENALAPLAEWHTVLRAEPARWRSTVTIATANASCGPCLGASSHPETCTVGGRGVFPSNVGNPSQLESHGFRLRYGPPNGRRAAKDQIALAVGAAINRNKVAKHFGREPPNKTDYDVLSSDLTRHGWMQADMQPFSSVATRGPPVGSPARKRQTVTSNSPAKARTSLALVD
jgi:hypothetical protein